MEVYAAIVDSMDQGIGRIIEQVKKQGQFDITLFSIFKTTVDVQRYGRYMASLPECKPMGRIVRTKDMATHANA